MVARSPNASHRCKGMFLRSVKSEADEAFRPRMLGSLAAKELPLSQKPIDFRRHRIGMLVVSNNISSSGGTCQPVEPAPIRPLHLEASVENHAGGFSIRSIVQGDLSCIVDGSTSGVSSKSCHWICEISQSSIKIEKSRLAVT